MVCLFHFTNYSDIHGALFDQSGLTHKVGELGILGVFVFFIITGFVIPLSLFKHNFKLNHLHQFLSKRWLRIEIPYLVSVILVLLVTLLFSIKNHESFLLDFKRVFHHIFYTAPFFNYDWYNPIYWTLAIEMQFYILIAFMFPLLKLKGNYVNCILPLLLAVSALVITDNRIVFHYGAIFSQGILLLLVLKNRLNLLLGIITILVCNGITWYINGFDIAIATLITIGLIAFVNIDHKKWNKLGDISYSLYLTHGLTGVNLIYLFSRYTKSYLTKIALVITATIFSLLTAYVFWKIIENPSKKLASKIKI